MWAKKVNLDDRCPKRSPYLPWISHTLVGLQLKALKTPTYPACHFWGTVSPLIDQPHPCLYQSRETRRHKRKLAGARMANQQDQTAPQGRASCLHPRNTSAVNPNIPQKVLSLSLNSLNSIIDTSKRGHRNCFATNFVDKRLHVQRAARHCKTCKTKSWS